MGKAEAPAFLSGGGELGALMRETEWSLNPLGVPEGWPQSLKTAVRIMLTSRQPIWIGWGGELIYLYNDAYKSIIGGKHPRALGQPTRTIWAEIWDDIGPMLATAMKGDEGTYVEEQLLIMERNGYPEETYYTFSYSPIPDDDGSAGGIICANTDDTQRVIGERQIVLLRELAAQTADARTIADACQFSAEALATNGRDTPFGLIYLAENGSFRLTGRTGNVPAGSEWAPDAIDSGKAAPWPIRDVFEQHALRLADVEVSGFAGSLPTGSWGQGPSRVAVIPIPGSGEKGSAGALVVGLNPFRLFDKGYEGFLSLVAGQIGAAIANAEAYEQERRRVEALAEIDRAKTAFFSNVSHEFRTPLTLMLGPLEDAIAEADGFSSKNRERLDVAYRNSQRLLRLVNSLLDFSRLEAGRIQAVYRPTDLGKHTAELVSSFRAATERAGLKLTVEVPANPKSAYVDPDMWEKIVLNLLSNAFKFTLEGEITVRLEAAGDKFRLSVSDTGIGIPEAELPKLFERFHRVEGAPGRSYEGSGIGLALVAELVRLHGGDLRVESSEGKGTTFFVEIPAGADHLPRERVATEASTSSSTQLAHAFVEEALRWVPGAEPLGDAEAEIVRDASSEHEQNPGRSGRILLADDNSDLRNYIARLLQDHGYAVEVQADGRAALEAVRREKPDLLITDVMMPNLDGLGLLAEIRADRGLRDLSVIMLSARSGQEARIEGLHTGADDYLTKPFSARELVARVDSHIAVRQLRKEATAALRESEARFRALTTAASDVVYRMSRDGRQMSHLDGRGFIADTKEATVNWIDEYVFPEDRPAVQAAIEKAIENRSLFELEHRVRRTDGSVGWTFSRAIPVISEEGEIAEWFGMAADITDRKNAETALRESEARFRNMADHSPLMMWVTNPDGFCTYLNRSWYEFTGQTVSEAEGFGWLNAVHPDDRGWSDETFRTALANREPFRLEYRLRDRDGRYRWAMLAASPRFEPNGESLGYIGSVLDIDDRKRAESLRVLQNQLLELTIQDLPLPEILEELVLAVEARTDGEMKASILLLDPDTKKLRHGAAPSLPDAYRAAIDGIEIGPQVGSCGTAAFLRQPVFVSDIQADPLWRDFRELAGEHDLRACWSTPIFGGGGEVLATFAMYYSEPRSASKEALEIVSLVAHTVAMVIERKRIQSALHDETRMLETLNRTGAALAGELDLERVVQSVTDAGVELTGAHFGAFFYNVRNSAGESLMLYTISGVDKSAFEKFPMPRKTEVFGPTLDGVSVLRSGDITKDDRYGKNAPYRGIPEGHLPVRSYLAVPVVSRSGGAIGGLFFGHPEADRFTDRHEKLMVGVAGHAAVALDNANLFDAAQKEIEQRTSAEKALQQFNEHLEARVVEEIDTRRRAEAALQQAQRMESIGQLTGGVAHDFNNLLQVISGNLQLLLKDVAGTERAERRIQNALTGVSRGSRLAAQLLAFGRRQALDPKVLNIGRLVRGLDEMLRRALGEEIEIETTISGGLWNTFADPSQVENALLNLAINARDAMGGSGKLTIEAGNAFLNDEYARANADVAPGQYVMLAVTDTGSGIKPELLDKVFEPFFTTKGEGKGTGLGLSMVYGFAKQSHGHVKIYSEVALGTTIKLYLPRTQQREDVLVELDQQPIVGGSETILVVEDDEDVRAMAVEMLSDLGYRVLKAPEAASALAVVESGIPIDMLFTDVVMPGPLRSPELARKAKERIPDLAVLFTSGYSENAIVHGGRLDEGVNLLPKPYTREQLARKIRSVLVTRSQQPASAPTEVGRHERAGHSKKSVSREAETSLNVLVVEDDVLIRMSTVDILRDAGHTVVEAGTASAALGALQSKDINVMVTDLGLPDASGLELAAMAREAGHTVGLVFATGRNRAEAPDQIEAVWLVKPFSDEDLKNAVRSAINQKDSATRGRTKA